jgi:hypothetical protein
MIEFVYFQHLYTLGKMPTWNESLEEALLIRVLDPNAQERDLLY